MNSRTLAIAVPALLLCGVRCMAQNPGTFSLSEQFGVSWPEQPIEFRYDGGRPPGDTRMMGPDGREVPFQWVSSCSDATATKGCIVVRSGLPANAAYTWKLQSGAAATATPANPVQLKRTGGNYEITNGLTGIRIVAGPGNPRPWNRAPIQGVLLPDGAWTAIGASPNLLYSENEASAGCIGCALRTPMYTATGYSVAVVDEGPMKVVLKATYTFHRPRYHYGDVLIDDEGAGHYSLTVTLYAGAKSALIDEDSDMQFSYYLPLYAQLQPDQARYRGHDSYDGTGPNPVCGYESPLTVHDAAFASPIVIVASNSPGNGQRVLITGVQGNTAANGSYYARTNGYPAGEFGLFLDASLTKPVAASGRYAGGGIVKPAYRGSSLKERRPDAWLDITYSSDRPASYLCSANFYRKILTNYPPAAASAGFYLMIYHSQAGPDAPVVGIYTGRASQQMLSAVGPSMPGLYSSDKHWITGARDSGIQVDNLLRGANASTAKLIHRAWAIWTGKQSDILAPSAHQPIGTEQDSLASINLSHLYTYRLTYPDPPGGWKWLYLSQQAATGLISAVRDGTPVCGSVDCYYKLLYDSETSPFGRALVNMWKKGGPSIQAALDIAVNFGRRLSSTLATGDNHFDPAIGYYELGLETVPETAVLNAILMNPDATAAQKTTAKAALALFGCVLWDNDWFAIDNDSGEGSGLANQGQQYLQYRAESVAAAPSQPYLASKLAIALKYPVDDFTRYFSDTGAASASTHYQSAFFEPLIMNYMSFAGDGLLSLTDPKWEAYARWELSIQTPPEPRFGNLRKAYSNGDGNTEADVRTGLLGTALKAVNPTVAGNLMWAWRQSNSPTRLTEDAQFVTTAAIIDASIPSVTPRLGSINVPGYHASERHDFGTPNETALWFIDGGFYSTGGHRHDDDGQVTIYADAAPLAIDWNANLYSPDTPGRFMHNSVVYDSELKHPWDADNAGLSDAGTFLQNPSNTEFAAFQASTAAVGNFTEADGTLWTRSVRTMAFHPGYPILYVKDTFKGQSAGTGKTLTWNLMATGSVTTPAGPVTPVTRFSAGCQQPAGQLPSSGGVFALSPGLQRFTFTGANWPKHPSGGIDWDLYSMPAAGTGKFFIGNWGHGCHGSREMGEYQAANGAPFAESQHILRIHDTEGFTTILLPYPKTGRPSRVVT
ncbi:MAG TPA: hypothetical protein VGL72_33055, partial [Bryobacteraceae bacterium]